ncbi:hypothetical protein ACHZ98_28760 [Streptomyces sp. MAR4 CNY-716]
MLALPIAIAAALAVSAATAHAAQSGAGEWDYKGTYSFIAKGSKYWPYETNAVYSGGGSLKICFNPTPTNRDAFVLNEWDPGANADEFDIAPVYGSECWVVDDLDRFVDGDNNRAEFYLSTFDPNAVSVQYWD